MKRCSREYIATMAAAAAMILLGAADRAWALGCVASATPIAFGTYQPLHPDDGVSVSTITYSCTGVKGRVRIGLSRGDSGNFARRVMHQGNHKLEYNLYMDASLVSIWGDGSGGSQLYITSAPANNAPVTLTVYGRINARQDAHSGMYQDNIFVTIDP
jgi:spore coat protein U-like protein